jgi:sugar O-acyltransferase (sialic acid O-acetyltransferase NeuD family)
MQLIAIFGGHSSGLMVAETIDAMATAGEHVRLAGFLNDSVASSIGGVPVLGRFEDWHDLDGDVHFIAAFPLPGDARSRHARLRGLDVPPERWEAVRHPRALVSPRARLEAGSYVAANAVIEHGAVVGRHAIVRAGAYVSHDVSVGEFAFIGVGATLLGRSSTGVGSHVGPNSVCRERTRIGDYAVVGIGSVVVDDVAECAVVAGNPARPVR